MTQARDTQRSKLYKAEEVIVNGSKRYETIPQCKAYYEKIIKSLWFRQHGSAYVIARGLEVGDGRGRSRACADGYRTIKLPKWARSEAVMLHELAHIITMYYYRTASWHGREFAHTYLQLVKRFMGDEAHDKLKESFKQHKVKYTLRRTTK